MNLLVRHSSLVVLLTMILVTVVFSYFYHLFARESLINARQQVNLALAKSYANSIWPSHMGFVSGAARLEPEELKSSGETRNIHRDLRLLLRGIDVLNVSLLDLNGLVVYSTDGQQTGNFHADDDRFISARDGRMQSTFAFHDTYQAGRSEMAERYIVTSYVPIRILDEAPVEGVIAIDSDITSLMNEFHTRQIHTIGWLVFLMSLMYAFIVIFTNRTERLLRAQQIQREKDVEQMRYLAYHDSLTGFYNRISFNEHVEKAVHRAKRAKWTVAVMFLDLDRFKLINDSLGHDAGDQLLCITSQRIYSVIRECDILFRMGGEGIRIKWLVGRLRFTSLIPPSDG